MEVISKHIKVARNIESENQKELFEAETNGNEGMITNDNITTDNWVIKDVKDNRKDNIPSNVKEYVSQVIENATLQNNEEIPFQIVTTKLEIDKSTELEKNNFR